MSVRDLLIALFVMAIWGLNFPIAKMALFDFPPLMMMAIRFAIVAIILVPITSLPKGKFINIFLLSITFATIHFACMFTGLKHVDSSTASIMLQFQVPLSAIMAAIVYKDKMHWRRILGISLGFLGVVIIAGEPKYAGNHLYILLLIISAFFWATANIQLKSIQGPSILSINAWLSLFALPQFIILSYFLETDQIAAIQQATLTTWSAIAYMAIISTIIGYTLWYGIVRKYDISQTTPFTLLIPIYGVIFSIFLLQERLTTQFLFGALVTMAGVTIILARRPKLFSQRPPRF